MKLKVNFLDCRSHGDCSVITFKEGDRQACIVVDGGDLKARGKALADFLEQEGIKRIDLMVGTHIDQDHINGLKYFVQDQVALKNAQKDYTEIVEFWGPMPSQQHIPDVDPQAVPDDTGVPDETITWQQYVILSVKQNDELFEGLNQLGVSIRHPAVDDPPQNPFQNVNIELLGPDTQITADRIASKALGLTTRASDAEDEPITSLEELEAAVEMNCEQLAREAKRNANNQSIVFRLSVAEGSEASKEWRFLFTGDAEEEAWETMLKNSDVAALLPARVLKIPHHGSGQNGITPEGAAKVNPDYSVNLVGRKHGLPDKDALGRVMGCGSKILCTQCNDSDTHPSDCHDIPKAECPARDTPATVTFALDTDTGTCEISPPERACRHTW